MSTDGGVSAIHFGDYCISPWRKDKDAGYHFVVVVAIVVVVVLFYFGYIFIIMCIIMCKLLILKLIVLRSWIV